MSNETDHSGAAGPDPTAANSRAPKFSFEVFPPQTEAGMLSLQRTADALASVPPSFISVTFGAGGSRTDNSLAAVDVVTGSAAPVAAHLTCVGQTIAEVTSTVDRFASRGVSRIVALRGDPPEGVDAPYSAHPEGFQSTADLVAAIKQRGPFWVAVSAYPEIHPQSANLDHDLDVLEAKIAAGADAAMTQMFFDNTTYFDFVAAARGRHIDIPIIPGVFPIHDFEAVSRFATRCGATMPRWIEDRFADPREHDIEAGDVDGWRFETAVDITATQITELAVAGVPQVHLYTLNRPELALAVVDEVGRRTQHGQTERHSTN